MQLLGVNLRRPTFTDVTVMTVTATLLLVGVLALCAIAGHHPGTYTKEMFLASLAWGSLAHLLGIRLEVDWRHMVLLGAGSVAINLATVAIAAVLSR